MFNLIKPDLSAELIMRHEGLRLKPYRCSAGKLTIGYGRNIEDSGITEQEAEVMLVGDIERVKSTLNAHFTWYQELSTVRQAVVENMLFNLGMTRFMGFLKLNVALLNADYEEAAIQMLDSKWAKQVKGRAIELAEMMRTGEVKK